MGNKTVLTCTTFFRKDFSITHFIENFQTLFSQDPGLLARLDSIHIVNEYSEENLAKEPYYREQLATHFPTAIFFQKPEVLYGQAHSLNYLLDQCAEADYQIQWEEGWICTSPFLDTGLFLMEQDLHEQLGFSDCWRESILLQPAIVESITQISYRSLVIDPRFKTLDIDFSETQRLGKILALLNRVDINLWPLYSLRPSINRMSFLKKLGRFNTHPTLWPVRFEYLYSVNWHSQGGRKAYLAQVCARRSDNKQTTHNSLR